ncbi:glycoside hydrolase family 3 N-terminal domain-containing protein [Sediminitomix flava]|uniref:beta-glucosidase n=1 Tax=Sediminitomix flava TaxID=379075 RepID=A0A315ZGA6_SEDFL|nr:glycoside hydrolase family 3 N-terminal domain-containing protein [Sediminitomix flava]PWJ44183.1 beta-glucosidase [Sediminitomix flava]
MKKVSTFFRLHVLSCLSVLVIWGCTGTTAQSNNEDKLKIQEIISQMTLEEKAGQMTQVTLEVVSKGKDPFNIIQPLELDEAKLRNIIVEHKVGSILNCGGFAHTPQKWQDLISLMQEVATKETRLGIPILYGIDAIHGANYTDGATLFPQQIGLAATWNRELVEAGAKATAYETRASSIPWTFSPVLGLGKDPRWPRIWETFGEDPYLISEMGVAMINGFEGDNTADKFRVASCLKHYIGYSTPLSGKDRTPAWIPERQLLEYYVPSFEASIKAGAKTIMINSGEVNGVPVHGSYKLLTELLRDKLGFEGVAVTDWADIDYLHTRHRTADSQKEAVRQAIMAGVDMAMVPYNVEFTKHLIELVKEGAIPESRLDISVERILKLKMDLDLFEHPVMSFEDYPDFASTKHQQLALDAALESITLLKNNKDILPITKDKKVLITGPNANSMRSLNGGWSYNWQGSVTNDAIEAENTIKEAIENTLGKANTIFVPTITYNEKDVYSAENKSSFKKAVNAAKSVDYILLCLGENSYTEKPGDLESLVISENQIELAKEMAKTGKPIILILNEGRPRIIREIEEVSEAVLHAYLPGNKGGEAISQVLFGDYNPNGKLPYTYPRFENDIVPYYHKYTEQLPPSDGSVYQKSLFYPQWEFGFGLSYTTFEYTDLKVDKTELTSSETVKVEVTVRNTGKRDGKEVIQLYSSDLYASITPEVKRLRDFKKIEIKAGESQKVSFELPMNKLAFTGRKLNKQLEAGEFILSIGSEKVSINLKDSKTDI